MTRFLDSLSGTLAGLLIGVLLMAAVVDTRPFSVAASRPAQESTPADPLRPQHDEALVPLSSSETPGRTRIPEPAPLPTAVTAATAAAGTISGLASFVAPAYGARYLALPAGRGVGVQICGPVACVVRTSTDAGPDKAMQRAGRVADLSFRDFAIICGCDPWAVGLVRVVVTPIPAPPPTTTR